MSTNFPKWSDADVSSQLPGIREEGESASIEFKERFPDQAHRVAQELAAFATSGGGTVFIGIDDAGELVGIDASSGDERDGIAERAHGAVGMVKPRLVVEIKFAVENGKTILAISVPTQDEPIFYYDNRPYIRDKRRSRPATPEEVKERVWAHGSSEFKRELERIQLQRVESHNRTMARFGENAVEQSKQQDKLAIDSRQAYIDAQRKIRDQGTP